MLNYRFWVLVPVLALHGCAALSPDPCRSTDWYAIGYQEGLAGGLPGPLAGPDQSCRGSVAGPELASYRLGRDAGLAEYCQPHSGFRLGIEGRPYQGACGGAGEAEFLRAYQQGKQIHEAEAQIRRLDAILAINESERASLGERIGQKHTELGQRASRGEADAALRAELHELEETAALVAAEIDAIEAALREQHTELALLRQNGDSWLRHNP